LRGIQKDGIHAISPETKERFEIKLRAHMSMAYQWLYDHEGLPLDSVTEDEVIREWKTRGFTFSET
jgi:hypothetical protein